MNLHKSIMTSLLKIGVLGLAIGAVAGCGPAVAPSLDSSQTSGNGTGTSNIVSENPSGTGNTTVTAHPEDSKGMAASSTTKRFNFIQMNNATNGWAWGYQSGQFALYRTKNNGVSWQSISLPVQPPSYDLAKSGLGLPEYAQPYFLDAQSGWITWVNGSQISSLHTDDGGDHWDISRIPAPTGAVCIANMSSYDPMDAFMLVVSQAGSGSEHKYLYGISMTNKSWVKLSDSLTGTLPEEGTSTNFSFPYTDQDGWLTSGSPVPGVASLYHTTDVGKTWTKRELPVPAQFQSYNTVNITIPMLDQYGGTLAATLTANNKNVLVVYHSNDWGKSWQSVAVNDTGLTNVVFPDGKTGFALRNASAGLQVMHTTDVGRTWEAVASIPNSDVQRCPIVSNFEFVDTHHGWVLLNSKDYAESVLLQTSDGGQTWKAE